VHLLFVNVDSFPPIPLKLSLWEKLAHAKRFLQNSCLDAGAKPHHARAKPFSPARLWSEQPCRSLPEWFRDLTRPSVAVFVGVPFHLECSVVPSLGLSLCPISQKLNCNRHCVILARFQKFCRMAGADSACMPFAMTGCSGDTLKMRKMTGAIFGSCFKQVEKCQRHSCGSQIRTFNVIHVVHKSEHTSLSKMQMTLPESANSVIFLFLFGPNSSPWALAKGRKPWECRKSAWRDVMCKTDKKGFVDTNVPM